MTTFHRFLYFAPLSTIWTPGTGYSRLGARAFPSVILKKKRLLVVYVSSSVIRLTRLQFSKGYGAFDSVNAIFLKLCKHLNFKVFTNNLTFGTFALIWRTQRLTVYKLIKLATKLKFAMMFARMPFSEIETHSRTHNIKVEWSEGPGKVDQK